MRTALLFAVALAATAAHAQSTFHLVDPVLTVDNRPVGVLPAPGPAAGVLTITVPGEGTYRVSDQPFGAARRAGGFSGTHLAFAAEGKSVRLTSREAILGGTDAAPAYVHFEPAPSRHARGLARLSVAGGPPYAARTDAPRGPQAGPPLPRRDETDRLRAEIDRLTAERARLAAERDRFARGAAPDAPLAAERDRLLAERDRLLAERDRLTAERERAVADRADLALRLGRALDERDVARTALDARRADAEADALRARIVTRDQSLDVLRDERDDRTGRLSRVEADLADARQRLANALAARDAAYAERDAALAERDQLLVQRDRLAAERDAAFRERDAVIAEREARLRSGDGRRAEGAWQAPRRAGPDPGDAERTALRAERDALRLQLDALLAERDRLARRPDAPTPPVPPAPPARPVAPLADSAPTRDGSFVYLPGFDFGRLQNPDVVQRRLDQADYPRWASAGRLEGDVLVLFQTDPSGRVIRTAVPMPLGGGLDALAEGIVREMRFIPPVVDGLPTGLRSQVTVRFER